MKGCGCVSLVQFHFFTIVTSLQRITCTAWRVQSGIIATISSSIVNDHLRCHVVYVKVVPQSYYQNCLPAHSLLYGLCPWNWIAVCSTRCVAVVELWQNWSYNLIFVAMDLPSFACQHLVCIDLPNQCSHILYGTINMMVPCKCVRLSLQISWG